MTSFLPFVKAAVDAALAGNTVKAMLVTSGWDCNIDTDTFTEAEAFEPVDNGTTVILGDYPPGGIEQTVTTSIVSVEIQFTGTDITVTGATLPDLAGVVWYVEETGELIGFDQFPESIVVAGFWEYTIPDDGWLAYIGDPGSAPGTAPEGGTLFGFYGGDDVLGGGGSPSTDYARITGYLGTPQVYRMFYPGEPPADFVGSDADYGPPVVVSFKLDPLEVVAGDWDTRMNAWFASIPSDRHVWWSYYHEPEDNIHDGDFTAAQYRAAWNYLTDLAPKQANLHPTLILMRYSLNLPAERPIANYVTDGLEVLAWDSYYTGDNTLTGCIETPAAVSASFGLRPGFGEVSAAPPGAKMSTYANALITRAPSVNADFVCWFETNKSDGDWRMRPYSSAVAAWSAAQGS